MAVWRRKPDRRVVVHSDQGSQYGSDDFRRFCHAHNLEPSMSRRGNCWDNAVAESFFSSLKKERIRKRIYKTRDLARADVFDYIEVFYNRTRRHSHLGGVSPEAFSSPNPACRSNSTGLTYPMVERPVHRSIAAQTSVMLHLCDRIWASVSFRRPENKTSTTNAFDHRSFVWQVDLATQPTHMDIHEICRGYKLVVPNLLQEPRTR